MKKILFSAIAVAALMCSMSSFAAIDSLKPTGEPGLAYATPTAAVSGSQVAAADVAVTDAAIKHTVKFISANPAMQAERISIACATCAADTRPTATLKQIGPHADRGAEGRTTLS